MIQQIDKIEKVGGTIILPGDKSISHRAVMFSALAKGKSVIHNYLDSADVNSTINCFENLGCTIYKTKNRIEVEGKGLFNFLPPTELLDAGNSGTTARLISGILSAQKFQSILVGDNSLSKRPMKRIIEPLSLMNAKFEHSGNFTLPLTILPSNNLKAIEYKLPVASAQVKSAILLAGLHLNDQTVIIENVPTRNHTENLLGLKVEEFEGGRKIFVSKSNYPVPQEYNVPSDISTAAFFIVLALLLKNSELRLNNILLNETRDGILKILKMMGGKIEIENIKTQNGEKSGDLIVRSSVLKNVSIPKEIIPNIIDEIPILSIAGLFAEGEFEIINAKELRFKESDRIRAMCENFKLLGLDVVENEDGYKLSGNINGNDFLFDSYGDHRIAMSFGVLSVLLEQRTAIKDFECVAISNPGFLEQIKTIAI